MARVFISYSHKDEALRAELDAHLALLKREGVLDVWTDHQIPAGGEVHPSISKGLEEADIVLLLISQYFNDSEYCASIEMKRALERHAAGECVAVPVLLRPCDWRTAPYARLNAIPRDNRPVTQWPSQDAAFAEIVKELRQLIRHQARLAASHTGASPPATAGAASAPMTPPIATWGHPAPVPGPREPMGQRRVIVFASVGVGALIAAFAAFNVARQPGRDASGFVPDDPRTKAPATQPAAIAPAGLPVTGQAPPSASLPAHSVDAAPATTVVASPPASRVSVPTRSAVRAADTPRKLAGASSASDECQRLTGLLARGGLDPGDLPRLKEACNR